MSATSLGDGEVVAASDAALRIKLESGDTLWIPKSVIHDDSEVWDDEDNSYGEVIVQSWFAEKEALA